MAQYSQEKLLREIRELHSILKQSIADEYLSLDSVSRYNKLVENGLAHELSNISIENTAPSQNRFVALQLSVDDTNSRADVTVSDKEMDMLLQQNALLEIEVTTLCAELDELTKGIVKRGYLYKWRDREISYASKWGLRYFELKGTRYESYHDLNY